MSPLSIIERLYMYILIFSRRRFVGPPGTGKTWLGQRPFQRNPVGGVRHEAEIICHQRTYVASGPGLMCKSYQHEFFFLILFHSPVYLLRFISFRDEIDKIVHRNFHGGPGTLAGGFETGAESHLQRMYDFRGYIIARITS